MKNTPFMQTLINKGKIRMTLQDKAASSVKETGTDGKIDTPLTQECSPDVPYRSREQRAADERQRLTGIRNQHEATSAVGHACSNLMEMKDALPPAADERIDYLTSDEVNAQEAQLLRVVELEEARLHRLLNDAQ